MAKANQSKKQLLTSVQQNELLKILQTRFEKNKVRHRQVEWSNVIEKLKKNPIKIWSLNEMEKTGGEPDVVSLGDAKEEYIFIDCSKESPTGRRSVYYDQEGLLSRKDLPPKTSALKMAEEMGVELLNEQQYIDLQKIEPFDTKTSSWLKTPDALRELGGALFGDYRYGRTFIYHNGAQSYYAGRAFRGLLRIGF